MNNLFNYDDIEIEEKKLRKMMVKIYLVEKEYYKTKKYTIPGIRNKIREIIKSEYKKNIGG